MKTYSSKISTNYKEKGSCLIQTWLIGWVDLGGFGKKCFDFFGLQETVSRNSYMTTGLYRYSLAQPAILPPAQHMRGTSKVGSFNLSISKIIFDK